MVWAEERDWIRTTVLGIAEVFVVVFIVVLKGTGKWGWAEWGGAFIHACGEDTVILGASMEFEQNM